MQAADGQPLVDMVLGWIDREYPCRPGIVLTGPADVRSPRALMPVFWGAYDWHSSVHGHWLLARLARRFPDAPYASACREVLERRLQAEPLRAEAAFLSARPTFERPYGLAWLLQLDAELAAWAEPAPRAWRAALEPLVEVAAQAMREWIERLGHPVRTGAHGQSAFAMGLMHDWARDAGAHEIVEVVRRRAVELHGLDRALPLHLEPSGEDFLSPALAAADLVRRSLAPDALARWLDEALPGIAEPGALTPAVGFDREDLRLSHLDGLNLSRAWMLLGVARALPAGDPRVPALQKLAREHREVALESMASPTEAGGHWLASFAAYLLTDRGLGA